MSELYSREKINELVSRVKQGDKEAFGKIYDTYSPVILGVITRIVNNERLAESLLQAVFLQFWKESKLNYPDTLPLLLRLIQNARTLSVSAIQNTQQKNQNGVNRVYINGNANFAQLSKEEVDGIKAFDLIYFKGYSLEKAASEFGLNVDELKQKLRNELSALREVKVNG